MLVYLTVPPVLLSGRGPHLVPGTLQLTSCSLHTCSSALWGDAFTELGVIGKIFVAKKYLVTPSVFKLQKWFIYIKMG